MQVKDFFEYLEKNNFSARIEKMRCVDLGIDPSLNDVNGRYYDVWTISGGDVSCSGKRGEPLMVVANKWVEYVELVEELRELGLAR